MTVSGKIVVSLLAIALMIVAQLSIVDDIGVRHTEQGLNRALVTFGVSRGLNGVISVVQGTEVAIEPVGVGMTFTPGQILDPVNDLIERFSSVVLVSGTAFGVQRVSLDIVSSSLFSGLIVLLTGGALILLWFGSRLPAQLKSMVYRMAIIGLIIRFSVPAMAITSELFYQSFLAPQYQSSSEQLLSTTDKLRDIQEQTQPVIGDQSEEKNWLESARELYRSATNKLDMQQYIDDFTAAAENISEHAIKLIVVFVFQTIILPLGSVWLVLKAIRWVAVRRSFEFG